MTDNATSRMGHNPESEEALAAEILAIQARLRDLPRQYPKSRQPARWLSVYRGPAGLDSDQLPDWLRYGKRQSLYVRTCRTCESKFETNLGGAVYCSNECRGKYAVFTTKRLSVTCKVCARTFTPTRADGWYCSAACRHKAYRQRLAGAKS